jgi:hypothetical protein
MPDVTSSVIERVDYDDGAKMLYVEFRGGRVYRYDRVPRAVYERLLAAESKGQFFSRYIRDHYRATHITDPPDLSPR